MIRPLPERQISVLLLNIFFIFSFSEFVYSFLQFPYKLCNSSAFGQTVTVSVHDKSPSARGGCLLPPRFLTVCAVNAQTCLNCYLGFLPFREPGCAGINHRFHLPWRRRFPVRFKLHWLVSYPKSEGCLQEFLLLHFLKD